MEYTDANGGGSRHPAGSLHLMGLNRERLLIPLALILGAVALVVLTVRREQAIARDRVTFEDRAFGLLSAVSKAQHRFHEANGRYGWIADLEEAGLLRGWPIEDRDGHRVVTTPRYRLDVLLPYSMAPGDLVLIATRDKGQSNPDLERAHFVVVARPWGEERTGFRTYYVDETGDVIVSEGVSDVASRSKRPLPEFMLSMRKGYYREAVGLRWWYLDHLPGR